MKVSAEKIPDSQVLLEIEVDPERVERSIDRASRKVAGRVKIPGFRPGKAPRAMVERVMGREALLREALDELVPDVYREALQEQEIEPINQPSIELVQLDPLIFKATVPVQPQVDLGSYQELRVERQPAEVNEDLVDQTLEQLQRRYATLAPAERPVQQGDYVRADVRAEIEGETVVDQKDAEFPVREDVLASLPGLAEALPGTEAGTEREISATIPEDFPQEEMRGQAIVYYVTVREVKEEQLPALDDDFAKQVGEEFETLEQLRSRILDDIRRSAEEEADARYREEVVDALVGRATLEYPPVLVDREVDRMIRERAGQGQQDLRTYLQQARMTEEELREQLRPEAVRRVERSLVLTEVAQQEGISVEASEIDAEIDRMAGSAGQQSEQLRQIFDTPNGRDVIARSLLTRKTLDRLAEIASQGGGTRAAAEGKDRKRSRKAPRSQEVQAVEEQPAAAHSADDPAPGSKPPEAPLADSPDDAPPEQEAKDQA